MDCHDILVEDRSRSRDAHELLLRPTSVNADSKQQIIQRRAVAWGAFGAAGIAALAMVSWWSGRWQWGAFGDEHVPMAPLTACLTVLLSGALFLRHRWPSRWVPIAAAYLAALAVVAFCLLALTKESGAIPSLERWLADVHAKVGGVPVGRISVMSAGGLLVAALALLTQLPPIGRWRELRQLAAGFALMVTLLGLSAILGYAMGVSILHESDWIPMAPASAVALTLLGAGLLFAAGLDRWPLQMVFGQAASALPSRRSFGLTLLAALMSVVAATAAAGFFFLNHLDTLARKSAMGDVTAIADLKVRQIVDWRAERLGDARSWLLNPFMIEAMNHFLKDSTNSISPERLTQWLDALREHNQALCVALTDATGRVLLVSPSERTGVGPIGVSYAQQAMRSSEVVMSDLHRSRFNGDIHLDLAVPILAANGGPAIGAIDMEVDPERFLYPLLREWPTPSRTGETLLVRREGGDVLFLSELRHRTNTALALRMPIGKKDLPAAMAARGETGRVEGADYRGVPVLAVIRAVPDTPWFMIAKVDRDEIYAELRRQAQTVWGGMGLLAVVVCLSVAMLWRRHDVNLLRRQLWVEQERVAMAQRIEHLMKNANDIILLTDKEWKILEANDRAVESYGYSRAELLRMRLTDLRAPEAHEDAAQQVWRLERDSTAMFETVHRRKDGTTFPVESSDRFVEVGGVRCGLAIIRDITQRKEAQELARQSAEKYRFLFENMLNGFAYCRMIYEEGRPQDFVYLAVNDAFEKLTGLKNVVGRKITEIIPGIREADPKLLETYGRVAATGVPERFEVYVEGLQDWFEIAVYSPAKEHFVAVFDVITERKRLEGDREITVHLLRVFNAASNLRELLRDSTLLLKEWLDCDAVGIRLREDGDYPYFETRGFPAEFVRAEDKLCLHDAEGRPLQDSDGHPVLDCMCGNVICGRFNRTKPFFTARGSFWTNSTTELLAGTTEADRQGRTRNRCNGEGYESVALVALRTSQTTCGLLQINDKRKGRFTPERVALLERLADNLAVAIAYRLSQQSLRESEERYRRLVESSPDTIFISSDRKFVYINPAGLKLFGADRPEQLLGKFILDFIHPRFRQEVLERMAAMERNPEPLPIIEEQFLRLDGSVVDVEAGAMPFTFEGKPGAQVIVRDISARKQAEELMLASRAKMQAAMSSMTDAVFISDSKGRFIEFNDAFATFHKFKSKDQCSRILADYNAILDVFMTNGEPVPSDQWAVPRALRGETATNVEHVLRRKDTGETWVGSYSFAPIRDKDGTIVGSVVVGRDITERKRTEEEINTLNAELETRVIQRTAQLEAANKELEAFSYSVSHDLRAPLRAINGFANILVEDHVKQLGEEGRRTVDIICDETKRMGQLIDDLLAFSRVGRQSLDAVEIDMGGLAQAVFDECAARATGRQIQFQLHPLPPAEGDWAMLRQVWVNLISNAIKYTRPKETAIIEIGGRAEGSEHLYYVKDNGVGFDMKYVGKLFGVFQRLHGDAEFEGTGVGLAIVQRVIHRHGGRVRAEATLNEGAMFCFSLPVRKGRP